MEGRGNLEFFHATPLARADYSHENTQLCIPSVTCVKIKIRSDVVLFLKRKIDTLCGLVPPPGTSVVSQQPGRGCACRRQDLLRKSCAVDISYAPGTVRC
jgi:hypothetical protein